MGRVESGSIAVGDAVTILPAGLTTRVREIRSFDGAQAHAALHAAVTIELDDEIDVARGDMLVQAHAGLSPARSVQADVCWLSASPLDVQRRYILRHTTRELRTRVSSIDYLWNVATQAQEPSPPALAMNDIGRVGLALGEPLFADRYADNPATGSFILIDETSNSTVAAGMIR
jgi:sulfate adenylyltransferase subunit 1